MPVDLEKQRASQRRYVERHPGKRKETQRKNWAKYATKVDNLLNIRLKSRYGITLDQYREMLAEQNNGCAMCGKSPEENGKRLCVDHNHKTDEVRGLLCVGCNRWVGLVESVFPMKLKAIAYLKKFGV